MGSLSSVCPNEKAAARTAAGKESECITCVVWSSIFGFLGLKTGCNVDVERNTAN
jgi:hypothetical protein